MYQSPAGSTPASAQIAFSLVWVPESSPRETKGSFGFSDLGQGRGGSSHALDACRVVGRADDDKVVVHQVLAAHAVPGIHKGVLPGAGVHHQHIGVAILAQLESLAGAHGNDVYLDAVLLLKVGQEIGQQTRVLGAGGGGQDQLPWLRWFGRLGRRWNGRLWRLCRRDSSGLWRLGRLRGTAAANQDARQQHENTQQDPCFL